MSRENLEISPINPEQNKIQLSLVSIWKIMKGYQVQVTAVKLLPPATAIKAPNKFKISRFQTSICPKNLKDKIARKLKKN